MDIIYSNLITSGTPGTNPVFAAVGDQTGSEEAAQAGFYLGYLAELSLQYISVPRPPGISDELTRIVNLYFGPTGFLSTVTDPTMDALIKQALNVLAPGGSAGSITDASVTAFFAAAYANPTDPSQPNYLQQVWNWFSNGGFTFGGDTSPDTTFAFTMFIASVGAVPGSDIGLSQDVNQFMGEQSGGSPVSFWASEFLAGYAYTQDPTGNLGAIIATILPTGDPNKTMSNYDAFMSNYQTNYTKWSTSGYSLDAIYFWYKQALEHPNG